MLLQLTSAAVAECAIEVKYVGKKAYATIVIDADGGAGASPLISLGVSDTSVAQAVTNKVTAFTGATTSTVDDIIVAINNASGGTIGGDDEISIGDFLCRAKDVVPSVSCYHATVAEYTDEAGTAQNLKGYVDPTTGDSWFGTLVRDNDADGVAKVCVRIPPPRLGKGPVAIRMISGITTQTGGTAITNGIERKIIDAVTGAVLWQYTDATPTESEAKFDMSEPVVFPNPVIVQDQAIGETVDYADVDATTLNVLWGFPPNTR